MSVRIFKDIEEALSREVRRLTYHDSVTLTDTVLQDAFDPFTGEIVQIPLEPQFYDSSADTQSIDYPNIFVKLLRTREDRFSGRVIPQYGRQILVPVATAPRAYEIIANGSDGSITAGNNLITSLLKIHKIVPGNLLRILNGDNQGTYRISSTTPDSGGSHVITVEPILVDNLSTIFFDPTTREIIFSENTDLNSVKIGDIFTDASSNIFTITAVDSLNNKITIDGTITPDTASGSSISRSGDVFVTDLTLVRFIILDQNKPITVAGSGMTCDATSDYTAVSPAVPIDAYYLIRIDSKERQTHIEILNRMWEEFNPPRTGLPVVVRTALSAETLLSEDVISGGSQTIKVKDNSLYNIGDPIIIFDDLSPSKKVTTEEFERPFSSFVSGKSGTNELVLKDTVPDTFTVYNNSRVVSYADLQILMFHFVDHKTRDVESAQYWVHEFTFWVQAYVDRLGEPARYGTVTSVDAEYEIGIDC